MDKKHLGEYFDNESHAKINEFFFTTDGQAFYTENEALNHQKALRQKGANGPVTKVTRAEYDAWQDEAAEPETIEVKDNVEIQTQQPAINNPEPPVVTVPQKMALGKQRKKVTGLLEGLEAAKTLSAEELPEGEIERLQKLYDDALAVFVAMPGYTVE